MLLDPVLQALELEVAPLQFDHSTLGQKAWPDDLLLRFKKDGGVELLLKMERQAYGLDAAGSLAEAVPAGYVRLDPAQLLANAAVAVDPNDGFPRYRLRAETVTLGGQPIPGSAYNTRTHELEQFAQGQNWKSFLDAKPEPLILQDKYFGVMCRYEPVVIFDLLLAYAQQADVAPSVFAVQA